MHTTRLRLRVRQLEAFSRNVPLRIPFRFGNVTMSDMELGYLRVVLQASDGREVVACTGSTLSPAWFDKRSDVAFAEKRRNLLLSVQLACGLAMHDRDETAFALHERVQQQLLEPARRYGLNALTAGFGLAMLDSAIVDGVCRLEGACLHEVLRDDLLGFGPIPGLPGQPLSRVHVRHTIGLSDPITNRDAGMIEDGLPCALDAIVRRYGNHFFKVKLSGDRESCLARLRAIVATLDREQPGGYLMTMDGNEAFASLEDVGALTDAMAADPVLARALAQTLWIEQPMPREASLTGPVPAKFAAAGIRIILDEADSSDRVVEEGLRLGFHGVSAKNCKGLYRTLHSFRYLRECWARGEPGGVLSSEDLTSPGLVPLHQDTALAATLGCEHLERNGHHYVRGLSFLTPQEQETALQCFPTLYERDEDGLVALRIVDGQISTSELVSSGYGGTVYPNWDALQRLELPAG